MTFDAVIAIPTFRRPAGLARLLASLRPSLASHRVAVLVGDNACDPAIRALVEDFARDHPHTRYLPVADRGISQNRNALLAAWRADYADVPWLGMLDDDLVAPPGWLTAMLAAGRDHQADLVGGPYRIDLAGRPVSRLVRNSILLNRADHRTGPIAMFHAGGNMLIGRDLLLSAPLLWFDPALGRSGGEDLKFLSAARTRGARFAWSAEALCIEDFPIERASARYVLGRYYSTGNTMALIDLDQRSRPLVAGLVTRRLVASLLRMAMGLVRADADRTIRRLLDATWALGGLAGALGLARSERYR